MEYYIFSYDTAVDTPWMGQLSITEVSADVLQFPHESERDTFFTDNEWRDNDRS